MFLDIFLISDDVKEKSLAGLHCDIDEAEISTLIESAKNGDDAAFSSLVGYFEKFVYNIACRILLTSGCSVDAADDIAQEAFIKAWRYIGAFRGDCTFSTWLFRITVNTARDSVRATARKSTVSLTRSDETDEDDVTEWDVPVTSGDEIPEDFLEKKELICAIRRAIEELPEDQRIILVMRDISELPYHEIAAKLGIELGTVKSRLNRGRAALKTILKKYDMFKDLQN